MSLSHTRPRPPGGSHGQLDVWSHVPEVIRLRLVLCAAVATGGAGAAVAARRRGGALVARRRRVRRDGEVLGDAGREAEPEALEERLRGHRRDLDPQQPLRRDRARRDLRHAQRKHDAVVRGVGGLRRDLGQAVGQRDARRVRVLRQLVRAAELPVRRADADAVAAVFFWDECGLRDGECQRSVGARYPALGGAASE